MAVVPNASTLSIMDDVIDSEFINRAVVEAVSTPKIYPMIVNLIDLTSATTRTYAHPILEEMGVAAAVTETDEVGATALALNEITISVALVAKAVFVSEQAQGASIWNTAALAINRVVESVRRKVDNDVIGLSSAMTNSTGAAATAHSLTNWSDVLTTFRAQVKTVDGRRVIGVLAPGPFGAFHKEALTSGNAILGSAMGPALVAGTGGPSMGGPRIVIDQIELYESDTIPTADTTGKGNFLATADPLNGALGLVVKRGIRGDSEVETRRFGRWFVASIDYGVGILDQERCLEFITAAT